MMQNQDVCCVWHELVDENDVKLCEVCDKVCGTHNDYKCVGLCWCQSIYVICKNCFDYKCEICGMSLDCELVYIGDAEPQPICANCILKRDK